MKLSDILTRRNTERFALRGTNGYDRGELIRLIDAKIKQIKGGSKFATSDDEVRARALALLEPVYREVALLKIADPNLYDRRFLPVLDRIIVGLLWNYQTYVSDAQRELDENFRKAPEDVVAQGFRWAIERGCNAIVGAFPEIYSHAYSLGEFDWLWFELNRIRENQEYQSAIRKAGEDYYLNNPNALAIEVWTAMDKAAELYAINHLLPGVLPKRSKWGPRDAGG